MKLNKVIINGKVYYEEVKENEEKSDIVIENDEEVVKDNDIEEKKKPNTFTFSFGDEDDEDDEDDKDDEEDDDEDDEDDDDDDEDDDELIFKNIFKSKGNSKKSINLVAMMPFLDDEEIDKITDDIISGKIDISNINITSIAPFLGKDNCSKLMLYLLESGNANAINITSMSPFVSRDTLAKIVT